METGVEYVACPLCGADRAVPQVQTTDLIYGTPGQFTFVRCVACDLIYQNPRPTPDEMRAHYPDLDYHAFRESGRLIGRVRRWLRRSEARALLVGLPHGANVLEIGAGTGDLLAALSEAGAAAVGYEPNAAAVAVAITRAQGRGLAISDDLAAALERAPFDAVLMHYSLEHVHDLRGTLQTVCRVLKPGGRAVFWVPNAASWEARLFGKLWRGLDAPRHLQIFTPQTMRRALSDAGLMAQSIQHLGVPNDWAGSAGFWLRTRFRRTHRAAGSSGLHPLALAMWLPISMSAALCRASGRIWVTGVRPSEKN